jgi:hypothetical protein
MKRIPLTQRTSLFCLTLLAEAAIALICFSSPIRAQTAPVAAAKAQQPTTLAAQKPSATAQVPAAPVTAPATPDLAPQPSNAATPAVQPEAAPITPAPTATAPNPVTAPANLTGVQFLTPKPEAVLDIAAATVTLQFPTGKTVELRANGTLVKAEQIGRTEEDSKTGMTTQTWYGVNLKDGPNTLTAKLTGTAEVSSVNISVRGVPTTLKISTEETRIPADGRSVATVKGQLLDAQGNLSSRDGVVTLSASAGEFVGADADPAQEGFQAQAKRGEFTAQLQSGLKANTVQIKATAANLEAYTQITFETSLRPSIATGVIDVRIGGRGNDFYRSFRDFLPTDRNNDTVIDARAAAFATGRVGDWLFTGAFNSDRPINRDSNGRNNRLLGDDTQFSEQAYPVYGDSSTVTKVTPSRDRLYLRFERTSPVRKAGTDYLMWGDYSTAEEFATPSQELTATQRSLHGFKANYNIGNLQVSALYASDIQGFQRDTIAPDGTSGYYFLSHRLIQSGSENIFIELEELNRPGTVLEVKQLNRGADYDIDYDRGSILFREPILRTDVAPDGTILVRKIVTTYQFDNAGSDAQMYGGRLRYHFSREQGQERWIGATYLRESQSARAFELYGADAMISLGNKARIIAEYAHSSNNTETMSAPVTGSAYRIIAEGEIVNGIFGRAYYRSADAGFANNATISFVPGQTRYGAELKASVGKNTALNVRVDHEDNTGIAPRVLTTLDDLLNPGTAFTPGEKVDNSLTTISAGVDQKIGKALLSANWIHRDRTDRIATSAFNGSSDQLQTRFQMPLSKTVTLQALNELSLGGSDPLYSNRTLIGVDWAAMPGVKVRLSENFLSGGQYGSNLRAITSLDVLGTHKLIKSEALSTDLTGRFSVLGGQSGMLGQAAVGLKNEWTIRPGLRMNLSYEYVFANFFGRTAAGSQFVQPYAVGQGGSALGLSEGHNFSVGFEYTDNPDLKASIRYDYRTSSRGSNSTLVAAIDGKFTSSLTGLVRYQQAGASNQGLESLGNSATLRVGLAYRNPKNDKFNALLRYEYRRNPSTTPDSILFGTGTGSRDHTIALEGIYAPNWQWEFYGKFAYRNSTTYLAKDLVGSSAITLGQLRATYRFDKRWDITAEARFIGQPSQGYTEIGAVAEVGYYLTPNLRLAAGYSFGNINDRDFDGSRSNGGPYVGLTVKINELFNGFGLQKVSAPKQQEKAVPALNQASEKTPAPVLNQIPAPTSNSTL